MISSSTGASRHGVRVYLKFLKRSQLVYEPSQRQMFSISPVFMAYLKTFRSQIMIVDVRHVYVMKALLELSDDHKNGIATKNGYWLAALMTRTSLVALLALDYLFFLASRIGAIMRLLTVSLVYEKALRLSSAARQECTTVKILTLMSVDTDYLLDFYAALAGAVVLTAVMILSIKRGDRIARIATGY
uniref:Uncharacterized protein n=1 Tax=Peronospora matthiolae TaxID=2874970 RepID=A0AAV1T896_9STRA